MKPRAITVAVAAAAATLTLTLAACGTANVPARAVAGSWDGDCENGLFDTCSSQEAADALDAADVWCRWRGPDVIVHVALRSHYNARLQVAVIPRYVIKDGGTHGNSYGSDVSRTIAPQATTVFDINAGRPKGVLPGTKVAKCNPKLQDADIIALAGDPSR